MKKLFYLILTLVLTGCVSNGDLSNECVKVDNGENFTNETIYKINFKNDIISTIVVANSYSGTKDTIGAIKLSTTTQNNFWKDINFNVITDSDTLYKTEYIFDVNNVDENVYNYFNLKKERTKLVKELKEKGYDCE